MKVNIERKINKKQLELAFCQISVYLIYYFLYCRLKNDTLQHLNNPDDNLFSINSLQPLSSLSDEKDASKKSISPFNLHAKLTSESLLRENKEGSCEVY